jgi:hypothetical protein
MKEEWASFRVVVYSAYMLPFREIKTQNRKGWHSKSSKREYRLHYVICRTNGSATNLTKYRHTLTAMTPNDSTMP